MPIATAASPPSLAFEVIEPPENVMSAPVTATIPFAKVLVAVLNPPLVVTATPEAVIVEPAPSAKRPIAPAPDALTEPPLIVVVPPLLVLTPSASTPVVTMAVSVS